MIDGAGAVVVSDADPGVEVVELSQKTLLARNWLVCEVCNKEFQREQNLQLHLRGHNLPPRKLKQKDQPRRVYVCPEPACVHHAPAHGLGDLTGIKKHFCSKHRKRKWRCSKCSKLYAVHTKTCGSRAYRCDCGTLFSRSVLTALLRHGPPPVTYPNSNCIPLTDMWLAARAQKG